MEITNLKEFRAEMLKAGYICEMHGAVYEFRSGDGECLEAELKQRYYKGLDELDFFMKREDAWGEDYWYRVTMNELIKEFLH